MAPVEQSFRPRPPAPSPSHSLFGLEKAVPPKGYFPTSLTQSSLAVSTPSLRSRSRSPFSAKSNLDKPLPEQPPSPSSVYSGDSGYTKIVESYGESRDDPQNLLTHLSKAQRDVHRGRIPMRLDSDQSPRSYLVAVSGPSESDKSISTLHLVSENKTNIEPVSSYTAPTFVDFSRQLKQKRNAIISPVVVDVPNDPIRTRLEDSVSPLTSPRHAPAHVAKAAYPGFRKGVDPSLVPAPLNLARRAQPHPSIIQGEHSNDDRRVSTHINSPRIPQRTLSQDSFSDDSFVIYNGAREVVKGLIKEKIKKKSGAKAKEDERTLSSASEKRPATRPTLSPKPERKPSWAGERRLSIQQGVTNLMRRFSISSPEEASPTAPRPRRDRQKAIPTTPYQRHGIDVWLSDNKKKRAKVKAERQAATEAGSAVFHNTTNVGTHEESAMHKAGNAFSSGTSQLIHALDDTKRKLGNSAAEKRRAKLKASIKHVGAASQTVEHCGAGAWI